MRDTSSGVMWWRKLSGEESRCGEEQRRLTVKTDGRLRGEARGQIHQKPVILPKRESSRISPEGARTCSLPATGLLPVAVAS